MQIIRNIVQSSVEPSQKEVGWLTIENDKPVLKFNINGEWKETDNSGENVDNHYRILVDTSSGLWLLSIKGNEDLSNDEERTDMTVVYLSTEESLMRWKFTSEYTIGQYKAFTGETISNAIDFDDHHQFPLYIDSSIISSARYGQLDDTDTLIEILQRLWGNCGEGTVRQFIDDHGNIYNVSKVTSSNTISVIKYIPEEQRVTFLFGSNVSFSDNAAIIAAMNGGGTVNIDLAILSSVRYRETDSSNIILYPNKTIWCSLAAETLNVTINTDGEENNGVMPGVTYLACKPDVKTINLKAGPNISAIFPGGPLSLTGSGDKLIQFTFVKRRVDYYVFVSKLGEDF